METININNEKAELQKRVSYSHGYITGTVVTVIVWYLVDLVFKYLSIGGKF